MSPSPNKGEGVTTNGIGKPCTSHLNLSRTLADVWRVKPEPIEPVVRVKPAPRKPFRPDCDYRLVNAAGQYLHQSGQAMTAERSYAWQGNYSQMCKARRCLPLAQNLNSIPVV